MTVIVYKEGVLAADSMQQMPAPSSCRSTMQKIVVNADRTIAMAVSGELLSNEGLTQIFKVLEKELALIEHKGTANGFHKDDMGLMGLVGASKEAPTEDIALLSHVLIMTRKAGYYIYMDTLIPLRSDQYRAFGSGFITAQAALRLGKSAKEAVEETIRITVLAHPPVVTLKAKELQHIPAPAKEEDLASIEEKA